MVVNDESLCYIMATNTTQQRDLKMKLTIEAQAKTNEDLTVFVGKVSDSEWRVGVVKQEGAVHLVSKSRYSTRKEALVSFADLVYCFTTQSDIEDVVVNK